ncbi:DNase I-like protein [Laetiporus sulphureus 93-53]|uniref:DNase I-like protein n=1 Tax=Laetiporus sulphureus 93-53 TaxID=1314785 RepID=A0A165DJC2_9APHY|nr:DNase I-like protein [Laetiporus sulphureus 93-53]KZT05009.1 DNase I-like protein [Laetiporus sulphureus 93-53]
MTEKLDIVLQAFLRPSEVIRVAVEAATSVAAPESDVGAISERIAVASTELLHRHKRILAVVSHQEPQSGDSELGCVFIFKHKHPIHAPRMIHVNYVVEHTFPIVEGFSIDMAQPRRNTLDLRANIHGNILHQPRTELSVTIHSDFSTNIKPVSLVTHDTEGLRSVLLECKRLKDNSAQRGQVDITSLFSWLAPYMTRPRRPAILSPIAPDLRALMKPLYTLLSSISAGIPGDEISDVALIREDWIRHKVREEVIANHNETHKLRIRIGTFNVNGKLPSQDLSAWVRVSPDSDSSVLIPPFNEMSPLSIGSIMRNAMEKSPESGPRALPLASTQPGTKQSHTGMNDVADPDLLVLAFQELDLSTEALLYSTKTTREDAWCTAAFAGLGEKAILYEKLASKQLVGILLVVIVKKSVKSCYSDIRATYVGAGIMGIMGNKGATAIRLTYTPMSSTQSDPARSTVLTFVNSHLAAFDEMYDRRNADFHDLSKRLIFDTGMPAPQSSENDVQSPGLMSISVFETDALFWMADLNYRINLPDNDIRVLLSIKPDSHDTELDVLQKYDQLNLVRRTRVAFEGFVERPLTHLPTYRFSTGVATDHQGYDIKRKPAWTDRILHMNSAMVTLRQLSYSSHPEITMSDHKPVSADFQLTLASLNAATFDSFVEDLWREVAVIEESAGNPSVKLSNTMVDLGKIHYQQRVVGSMTLENDGKVPCAFRFIGAEPGAAAHPRWLIINPMAGLLLPGQKVTVTISSQVDNAVASELNMGPARLECTLILHTVLGKDHFISVTGEYARTCFANDLTWLARLRGPIRALKSVSELLPEDQAKTAPKEVMRLIKWLMSNATEVHGLFLEPGPSALVQSIRECLDTDAEFHFSQSNDDPALAWAFADTLLQFLASLPEAVFPTALHARCGQVTSKEDAFELLDQLPSVPLNVWISVTAVLHYVTQQASSLLLVEKLVAVFSEVLLRDDTDSSITTSVVGKRNFLRYFIA